MDWVSDWVSQKQVDTPGRVYNSKDEPGRCPPLVFSLIAYDCRSIVFLLSRHGHLQALVSVVAAGRS